MRVEGNQIKNLKDATEAQDATTFQQVTLAIASAVTGINSSLSGLPTTWKNGVTKNNVGFSILTGTITSGTFTGSIANASNVALFSEVLAVIVDINSSTNIFSDSQSVAGDLKSVTITAKQQTFTGVTILGINVLGQQVLSNAPNGTPVTVRKCLETTTAEILSLRKKHKRNLKSMTLTYSG